MKNKTLLPNTQQSVFYWRSSIVIMLVLFLGLSTTGCKNDEETTPTDEYYVKYEVNSSTIYYGGKLDLTLTTESNEDVTLVINQGALYETIIGPVEKGFIASMSIEAQGDTRDRLRIYSKIHVSKNGSPFALKKIDGSDEPREFVQLKYTID